MKTYGHALILGAGLSGLGAARMLAAEGTHVTVADRRPASELAEAHQILNEIGATMHFAKPILPVGPFDVCVVSPGFADRSEWVRMGRTLAHEVISELELGWSRLPCPVIAITGSNGKSTAVKWCTESLQQAGLRAVAAGNYGVSVCEVALSADVWDWVVLEVSSFQLETVQAFRPKVAVLTNIHPNHLDRHGTMEAYTEMKARLFANTSEGDICLTPPDLQERIRSLSQGRGEWRSFGSDSRADYHVVGGQVLCGDRLCADFRGTLFGVPGMAATAAAVTAILDAAGVDPRCAEAAASSYEPLPYRVQHVGDINGVHFVNDSKSTNFAAIAHALHSVTGPVRLIAGGLAKENDFNRLKEVLAQRVETVYLIGHIAKQMFSAWSRDVTCVECGTLDRALTQVLADAKPGDVVLFSPGCASFDQFRNYEERGSMFTQWVQERIRKGTS